MRSTLSLLDVVWLVRDAQSTKGAQRELLIALALRTNPKQNYVCWPSYAQLADDTQLDPVTLKRAAKALENRELIKRVVRKNKSNKFFLNVPLLQQQAAEAKAEKAEKTKEQYESPFGAPDEVDQDELRADDAEDGIYEFTCMTGVGR